MTKKELTKKLWTDNVKLELIKLIADGEVEIDNISHQRGWGNDYNSNTRYSITINYTKS